MTRFGFFGPTGKHDIPPGGFCISVFAVIKRADQVLVIKPQQHERWEREWTPNWRVYQPAQLEVELGRWRLPSTYVKEGEAPSDALARVMKDQLGMLEYSAGPSSLENFYEESRRFPGQMHWDYCFVYPVSADGEPAEQPWLAESRYLHPAELRGDLGSAQESLLTRLGLL